MNERAPGDSSVRNVSDVSVWRATPDGQGNAGETKTIQVKLSLHVQGYSKYVRGERKVRTQIEERVLPQHQMEKQANGWEYLLTISYDTDAELDRIINELLHEAASLADLHDCFIEAEVTALDGSERYW